MFIGQDLLHTTQGEHPVSLPILFLLLLFSFTLFMSVSIILFVCLSCTIFHLSLLFCKPTLAFPPCSSPPLSCTVYFLWLSSLLLFFFHTFVSPLPPLPLSVFISHYFGTSLSALRFKAAPSLRRRCSSLLRTWLSTHRRCTTD